MASHAAAPWLVKNKLNDFLAAADGNDVIAVAAIYYGRCLWIHPFEDGNGLGCARREGIRRDREFTGWVARVNTDQKV